jgi:diguanylate cyclase (GGDEF)-like protein
MLGLASLGLLTMLNISLTGIPALRALYILPIWIGTRLGGRYSGFILVTIATFANLWLDEVAGIRESSHLSSALIWLGVFSLVMLLVAQVEDSLAKSERLAHQDPLTGLFNRRGLEIEGRRVVLEAARDHAQVSVAMLDCDRFKMINDLHGHRAGDDALKFLARVIRENTRSTDVISRLGGDEFVLVMPHTESAVALKVLNRIQAAFDAGMADRGFDATLSVGLAASGSDARDLRTLVARADEEMYSRKEQKRAAAMAG